MVRFYTCIVWFVLLLSVALTSCQKDESVKAANLSSQTDSSKTITAATTPGNYLAYKGTLKIKMQDSTYTFDASTDSIAFINMDIDGEQYFGVTAINKAHTVSFGISSPGKPAAQSSGSVSGCQFLLHSSGQLNQEYTLTHNTPQQDYGVINMEKFSQDTVLAKGTFHTYLARDIKTNTVYVAEGSFDLVSVK